jgi:hypothetical protein
MQTFLNNRKTKKTLRNKKKSIQRGGSSSPSPLSNADWRIILGNKSASASADSNTQPFANTTQRFFKTVKNEKENSKVKKLLPTAPQLQIEILVSMDKINTLLDGIMDVGKEKKQNSALFKIYDELHSGKISIPDILYLLTRANTILNSTIKNLEAEFISKTTKPEIAMNVHRWIVFIENLISSNIENAKQIEILQKIKTNVGYYVNSRVSGRMSRKNK